MCDVSISLSGGIAGRRTRTVGRRDTGSEAALYDVVYDGCTDIQDCIISHDILFVIPNQYCEQDSKTPRSAIRLQLRT